MSTQADHGASNERRARELCGCDLCMGWEENLDGVRMEAMCQRGAAITAALDAARDAERERVLEVLRAVNEEAAGCADIMPSVTVSLIARRLGVKL